MGVGAIDRAEDGPDLVEVGHGDDFVAGSTPEPVVIADHQLERDLAFQIAAAGIGLLDGEPTASQHGDAEHFLVARSPGRHRDRGHDGPQESNPDRVQLFRLGNGPARAGILHLHQEMFLEGFDHTKGFDIGGRMGVVLVGQERQRRHMIGTDVNQLEHLVGAGFGGRCGNGGGGGVRAGVVTGGGWRSSQDQGQHQPGRGSGMAVDCVHRWIRLLWLMLYRPSSQRSEFGSHSAVFISADRGFSRG